MLSDQFFNESLKECISKYSKTREKGSKKVNCLNIKNTDLKMFSI